MQPENRGTALAFHAKDDLPEVRREVYGILQKANVHFYAVVRDKAHLATYVQQQNARDSSYRYRVNDQYDPLVKELFDKLHRMSAAVRICFPERANKSPNAAFRTALEQAAFSFAQSFGFAHPARNEVISITPPHCPGLQAVDYYLWGLQRFYERSEEHYLDLIWPQVGEVHDLDRRENGRRGVSTRNKSRSIERPLGR